MSDMFEDDKRGAMVSVTARRPQGDSQENGDGRAAREIEDLPRSIRAGVRPGKGGAARLIPIEDIGMKRIQRTGGGQSSMLSAGSEVIQAKGNVRDLQGGGGARGALARDPEEERGGHASRLDGPKTGATRLPNDAGSFRSRLQERLQGSSELQKKAQAALGVERVVATDKRKALGNREDRADMPAVFRGNPNAKIIKDDRADATVVEIKKKKDPFEPVDVSKNQRSSTRTYVVPVGKHRFSFPSQPARNSLVADNTPMHARIIWMIATVIRALEDGIPLGVTADGEPIYASQEILDVVRGHRWVVMDVTPTGVMENNGAERIGKSIINHVPQRR